MKLARKILTKTLNLFISLAILAGGVGTPTKADAGALVITAEIMALVAIFGLSVAAALALHAMIVAALNAARHPNSPEYHEAIDKLKAKSLHYSGHYTDFAHAVSDILDKQVRKDPSKAAAAQKVKEDLGISPDKIGEKSKDQNDADPDESTDADTNNTTAQPPEDEDDKQPNRKQQRKQQREEAIKQALNEKHLPTEGDVTFEPPKNWNPPQRLPLGDQGFLDRFGREWTKGRSITPGESFEWDVQLNDGTNRHINVSWTGRITH